MLIFPGLGGGATDRVEFVDIDTFPASVTLDHVGKFLRLDNGVSDVTLTINQDSVVEVPTGGIIYVARQGSGQTTVARGGSMVFDGALGDANFKIDKASETAGLWGSVIWLVKDGANKMNVFGPVKSV